MANLKDLIVNGSAMIAGSLSAKVLTSNYQNINYLGNTGNIALDAIHQIYMIKPTANQTVSIVESNIDPMGPTSGLAPASCPYIYTFELIVDLTSGAYTITFPSSANNVVWEGGTGPTVNLNKLYMFVFRKFGTENIWYASPQGVWY